MGKQTSYYITHDEFLTLAQAALDEGCRLLRLDFNAAEPPCPTRDLSAIDPTHALWYFVLPGAGEPRYLRNRLGRYAPDTSGAIETQLIETGFSVRSSRGVWSSPRLYIASDALVDGMLVPRPAEATRIYDKLARIVRKMAPTRVYTDKNGVALKLHVSSAIAEQAGPDGALLADVHERNHPLTADERLAQWQQMLDEASQTPKVDGPLQAMADSLLAAMRSELPRED